MKQVQENIKDLNKSLAEVKNHCMCAKFEEDAAKFRVFYPVGYFPEGVQVSKEMGKIKALNKLVEVMEHHFKNNY